MWRERQDSHKLFSTPLVLILQPQSLFSVSGHVALDCHAVLAKALEAVPPEPSPCSSPPETEQVPLTPESTERAFWRLVQASGIQLPDPHRGFKGDRHLTLRVEPWGRLDDGDTPSDCGDDKSNYSRSITAPQGLGAVTVCSDGDRRVWGGRHLQLDIPRLVKYLVKQARKGFVIVSWNGLTMDFRFLAEAWLSSKTKNDPWEVGMDLAGLTMSHVDLKRVYFRALAFDVELVDVARSLAGETEGGVTVLLALWEGKGISHGARVISTVWQSLMARECITWVGPTAEEETWRLSEKGCDPACRHLDPASRAWLGRLLAA